MAEQEEAVETEEIPPEGSKERGSTDYVEFPDEQSEKRFKRVYWSMKQNEKAVKDLAAQNKTLIDKLDGMEQREKKKEVGDQTSSLRAAEKEALENGDFERASQARDQITDLKLAEKQADTPVLPEEQWLNSDRESQIAEWAGEMDDKGAPVRPWCDDEHEDFETARDLMVSYAHAHPNAELSNILATVDKRMARIAKPKPRQANVLANGGDVRPKSGKKIALSEQEKFVARQMYANDPKALEKYAAAKEKHAL